MKIIRENRYFGTTKSTKCRNNYLNTEGICRCRNIAECDGCFKHYLRHWEMRCGAEAFMSAMTLFVTLTFRDEELHKAGRKASGHQSFKQYIQNLRRAGYAVRYVAAYEYGEKTGRPHYHAILFFGKDGKLPDFPLNVRADLPHWSHGYSQYEVPRTKQGALQYTLGYVLKGGGEILRPSRFLGKDYLLKRAEMMGRNGRVLWRQRKQVAQIEIGVPGLVVKGKRIDPQGTGRKYQLPLSHNYAQEMLVIWRDAYEEKTGKPAPMPPTFSGDF